MLFTYASNPTYLEVQRPYVERLLASDPELEYHLWDLTSAEDAGYVRELAASHPQIKRFDVPADTGPATPYRHYAAQGARIEDLFVRVEETVSFIETERFGLFLEAVREHPRAVVSASVVNNGLCAIAIDGLGAKAIDEGLVTATSGAEVWWDLCTSADFMMLSHEYFADHMGQLMAQDPVLTTLPRSRFSINTIGFNGMVMQQVAHALRDRDCGSEEEVITGAFDVVVLGGFLTSLLHTPDQRRGLPEGADDTLLALYREASELYLRAVAA